MFTRVRPTCLGTRQIVKKFTNSKQNSIPPSQYLLTGEKNQLEIIHHSVKNKPNNKKIGNNQSTKSEHDVAVKRRRIV